MRTGLGHHMRITLTLGAAVIAAGLMHGPAQSAGPTRGMEAHGHAVEHGSTLPPVGFVKFCARNPGECRGGAPALGKLAMSGERWRIVRQLNAYVNGKISPMSDAELYGEDEYWTYPSKAGDCEDYVLMKKRYLEEIGFAGSNLLITVVLDEKNEGHAVLTLRTDEGDFVLDNRRNEIRRWSDLGYVFLKRQSERDPRQWVSLRSEGLTASAMLSAPHLSK